MNLRAPFPWFGGKSRASELIWSRLGDVDTYNEPFAGSLAVLLGRPHEPRVETVNDLDCYLSNFWRALQAEPDQVAYWADYPVNETDLHARHLWLVQQTEFQARMKADPDYFDAKIAGWWVYGQCLWIGSGWCARPDWRGRGCGARADRGVHALHAAKRPKLRERGNDGIPTRRWQGGGAGGGSGVHAPRLSQQKPVLRGDSGADGIGIHSRTWQQMPNIAAGGSGSAALAGVHRKMPALSQGGNDRSGNGRGTFSEAVRSEGLYEYLTQLAIRLRRVRVCCGNWDRILTPSVTTYIGVCGVVLDPPYDPDAIAQGANKVDGHAPSDKIYNHHDADVSANVRAWAIENGDNPDFRIALCGYEGEHNGTNVKNPIPSSWECVPWKAHGGYSRTERGKANRDRERVWFSPHCLKARDLFTTQEAVS